MVMRNGSAFSDSGDPNGYGDVYQQPSSSQPIRVDELDHWDEDWIKPFPLKDGVRIRKGEKFSDYYTLGEEIGEGKFGKVYRCVEKSTGLVLAAKCIKIRKDTDFEKVEKEVNIMTQMRHKCIAQIYDAFATDSNDVILIMEMVKGGELFDRIADDSYILTEMAVALIMYQLLEAIRYIHSQNIIHLDLKPENIMCVSQTSNKVKLIDFGLAQWYDGSKDLLFMAGTPEFAAPEVIKYEPLSYQTDMWSLGVIAYILLSGQSPFLGETMAHTYCNVEQARWMFCEEFAENAISEQAKDFISRLLILQKEKRMSPEECLKHEWIVKNRERALENASRAVSPEMCHPLAVNKLRSYVKNKKFRRLVFGVLFINSVMRMLQTLQRNKSTHGIDYVRNMLAAAGDKGKEAEDNLLLKAFTKKKKKSAEEEDELAKKEMEVKEEEEMEEETKEEEEEDKMEVEEKTIEEEMKEEPKTKKRVVVVKRVRIPGEKKKRSKSEARRAAEQQRTRSSTEQTTNKKQRQEMVVESKIEEKIEQDGRKKSKVKDAAAKFEVQEVGRKNEFENAKDRLRSVKKVENSEEKKFEKDEAKESRTKLWEKEREKLRMARMEEERKKEEEKKEKKKKKEGRMKQLEMEREKLKSIKMEEEKKKAEHRDKEKTAKMGQVMKMAKKVEQQKKDGGVEPMPSTSALKKAGNSLVSDMLKRLEQQKCEMGGTKQATAPLAFAVSAVPPRKKEEEKIEKKKELVEPEPMPLNWRQEIKTMEEAAEKRQRSEEKKKQMKIVKRKKVVRRVKTADDEEVQMEEENRKKKMMMTKRHKDVEIDEKDIEVIVERTKERVKREKEAKENGGGKKMMMTGGGKIRNEGMMAPKNGQKMEVNGFGHGAQQRLKPRLKMSNSLTERQIARRAATEDDEDDSSEWRSVGHDVFDFSLLRMKLQNRIMGLKDKDELKTEAENRQKFELQKQQRELQTNLNIKRAMRKWVTMDKETRRQQTKTIQTGNEGPKGAIPEWAR